MLRINQFAKDHGVSNHDVIEVLEKRLGIGGKSHSSNLTDEQISKLERVFEAKAKGQGSEENTSQHPASIKVVKTSHAPTSHTESVPENALPTASAPAAPAVLLKKPQEGAAPDPRLSPIRSSEERMSSKPQGSPEKSESAASPQPTQETSRGEGAVVPSVASKSHTPENAQPQFSRLRVSQSPAAAPKTQEPARYIQLPQATSKPKPEAGAKAVVQRQGQNGPSGQRNHGQQGGGQSQGNRPMVQRQGHGSQVQRSGMPQPEKVVLPMASNTGKGEVKHEAPQQGAAAKRLSALPSISSLQPEGGFTKIKMADAPVPTAKPTQPARYIQLPQPRPAGGSSSPSSRPSSGPGGSRPQGARPSGPGGRPSGPGGPRPGGPGGARPGGPRPGGPRPGGPGRGPMLPSAAPSSEPSGKGPGRNNQAHGKKKKGYTKEQQEMDLKLRQPRSRAQQIATEYVENEIGIVMLSEGVTVKELAEKCSRPAKDVVAKLLHRGIFATINQPLDTELAKELAREFGFLADIVSFEEDVQMSTEEGTEATGDKLPRSPVVTIMGHVDHGKTSLLDAIRSTKVAAGEAGGITQAIGAYHVDVIDPNTKAKRQVVFIDTPGHEAFTKMRARGAKVTDIVILVVAADDGVMPQTIEAINHTKAADVPMVVAINKIDKPSANPDKVQQMLLQYGIQTEAYGGDVPALLMSAKTKQGLDELLETLLLVADLKELTAVKDCPAAGSILEAKLDRGRGPVATVLVQQGTLHTGDIFVAGATMGRVRAMFNDRGVRVAEAGPSMPVQILGFEDVPVSGDNFQVVEDEAKGRTIVGFRQEKAKASALSKSRVTLENIFSTLKDGEMKELPLIIKGDTQGSVESLVGSLEKLNTDKVRVRVIHSGAGTVTKNDVLLAQASKATVIAFGIKAERETEDLAQEEGVEIRYHSIIYKVTEEITAAMVGLLDATDKETLLGQAEIRQIFKIDKHVIAGSFVTEGKVLKTNLARVKRDDEVIWEGKLKSLKRFKEDVGEVKNGLDCGIALEGFDALKEGDILEFFTREKIIATSL